MPTAHLHRVLAIVPENRVAAVGAWWAANLDANDNLSTWPRLTASSGAASAAATHRWGCTALTDAQAKALLVRLCQLAGQAAPSNATWKGWTGAQKRTWLAGVRASILSGYGLYIRLADNVAAWDDAEALLQAAGLQRRVVAT